MVSEQSRTMVRLLSPLNLDQAMDISVRIEEKNRAMGCTKIGPGSIKSGTYSHFGHSSLSSSIGQTQKPNCKQRVECGIQRFTIKPEFFKERLYQFSNQNPRGSMTTIR